MFLAAPVSQEVIGSDVFLQMVVGDLWGPQNMIYDPKGDAYRVTHWMPLPEPPND